MDCNTKDKPVVFEHLGRKYELKLTFWVEAEMYELFGGGIEKALAGNSSMKNILKVVELLVNEAVTIHNEAHPSDLWETVTAHQIGTNLSPDKAVELMSVITRVFGRSRPEVDEEELTDEEKNGEASK